MTSSTSCDPTRQQASARLPYRALAPPSVSITPLTTRSSSSSRLQELEWTSGSGAATAIASQEPKQNRFARPRQPTDDSGARALKSKTRSGKRKQQKVKTFVVDAKSTDDEDDEADNASDERDAFDRDGTEPTSDDESSTSPDSTPPEPTIDEIIRCQIQQPTQVTEALDLDSLLPYGIGDYDLVLQPNVARGDEGSRIDAPSKVILGKGKFSQVLLAQKKGVEYALKHTPLHPHHPLIATRLLREPTILAQLSPHPNLVKVHETIRTPGHFYLVEESLRSFVTLEQLVTSYSNARLPIELARQLLRQLSSVVKSLHDPLRVCHRDIKPENLLVKVDTDDKLVLKLLDFGLATHFSASQPKLSTCCGSPAYHAPELWRTLREPAGSVRYWGPEIDIWTIGLTMLRCLGPHRYPLGVSHESLHAISAKVVAALLEVDDVSMREVLSGFLDMDGEERMKAFDRFVEEEKLIVPCETSRIGEKDFKTTSFIPTVKRHALELEVVGPGQPLSRTTSRESSRNRTPLRHNMPLPTLYSPPEEEAYLTLRSEASSALPSPTMTPSFAAMQGALPETLPPGAEQLTAALAQLTEILLINREGEPIRRCASYVKYALRCAGILYHVRDERGLDPPVASPDDKSPELGHLIDEDEYTCYLHCVAALPDKAASKASTALRAALRPALTRSATEGGAPLARSTSTPVKTLDSKAGKQVSALTFFLSIRKVTKESHPHLRHVMRRSRSGSGRRRGGLDLVVVSVSDSRALKIVRDALKPSPVSPTSESDEPQRGRTTMQRASGLPQSSSAPGSRSQSRARAGESRLRHETKDEGASQGLGLRGLKSPAGDDDNKSSTGFFDYAYSRLTNFTQRGKSEEPNDAGAR